MGVSVVPALVGSAFIAVGGYLLYRGRGSARWTPVAGTVVAVEIEARRPMERATPAVHFHPVLHYRYVLNGQLYRGTRRLGGPVTSRANAVRLGDPYVPGQPLDVFVDERTPDRHTLFRGEHRQGWWLIVFGMCWLALALSQYVP